MTSVQMIPVALEGQWSSLEISETVFQILLFDQGCNTTNPSELALFFLRGRTQTEAIAGPKRHTLDSWRGHVHPVFSEAGPIYHLSVHPSRVCPLSLANILSSTLAEGLKQDKRKPAALRQHLGRWSQNCAPERPGACGYVDKGRFSEVLPGQGLQVKLESAAGTGRQDSREKVRPENNCRCL